MSARRKSPVRGGDAPGPSKAEVDEIRSLGQFLTIIEPTATSIRWYRGVGDSARQLLPRLFRHPGIGNVAELVELEFELLNAFKQRSAIFDARERDDWDYLFLMQHFGVPTRLLDWTQSPMMALYFALVSGVRNGSDAAVWIMDPVAWNRRALAHISYAGGVLSAWDAADRDLLDGYAPRRDYRKMNTAPVALFSKHSNPRIVAQRGVFVVSGQDRTAFDASPASVGDATLRRLVVPSEEVLNLFGAVRATGVTASVAFPDLDGLATELRAEFGFD